MHWTTIFVICGMILANALLAAYELALASTPIELLRRQERAQRRGAKAAVSMKQRIEGSLATVQIGITLVGAVAAAVGGASAAEDLGPILSARFGVSEWWADVMALAFVVAPLSAVTIVVGELVPKVFALRYGEQVCLLLSPVMRWLSLALFPAVWVFEGLTHWSLRMIERTLPASKVDVPKDKLFELKAQVNLLRASQTIGVQEERIILRATRLSQMRLSEILVPADEIIMVEADAPLSRNLVAAHLHLHTRFPVTEKPDDPTGIIGYVTFKEMLLLAKTHPGNPVIREITRPLISLPLDMAVSEALRRMLSQQLHLALVRGPKQEVVGIVTQEDMFEELVGEIEDEFDRLPRGVTPSGRQWVVGGGATLGQLRVSLERPDLAPGVSVMATVDDWLERSYPEHHFQGGDAVVLDGVGILIRKVRRGCVSEILLEPDASRFTVPETLPRLAQSPAR